MLFDTHLHLDLFTNPKSLIEAIEEQKLYTIAVTNLPEIFLNTKKLCEGLKYIRPALGYHPELVFKFPNQFNLFCDLINETRYIGEIGLDNQRKTPLDYRLQKQIFEKIISVCYERKDKILTIHSRRAEKDIISIIRDKFPGKIILHWYSGTIKDLEIALSYGYYFSINSAMCQSQNGVNIIKNIPLDRLLLESDSPFIGVGKDSIIPFAMKSIVKNISLIKNVSANNLDNIFKENFRNLVL